jgi:hypothetical protein
MDVLAAILACSLYPNDDALVRALTAEAHANPDFVYDPTVDPAASDQPPEPRSAAQAIARAEEVQLKQATPLLGLLAIPPSWLAAYGRSVSDAFDACTNVAIGTAYLAAFDAECSRAPGRPRHPAPAAVERRACVLRRYADALDMPELVLVVNLELRSLRSVPPAVFEAPIFEAAPEHPWGPTQILAPVDPALTAAPSPAPASRGERSRP